MSEKPDALVRFSLVVDSWLLPTAANRVAESDNEDESLDIDLELVALLAYYQSYKPGPNTDGAGYVRWSNKHVHATGLMEAYARKEPELCLALLSYWGEALSTLATELTTLGPDQTDSAPPSLDNDSFCALSHKEQFHYTRSVLLHLSKPQQYQAQPRASVGAVDFPVLSQQQPEEGKAYKFVRLVCSVLVLSCPMEGICGVGPAAITSLPCYNNNNNNYNSKYNGISVAITGNRTLDMLCVIPRACSGLLLHKHLHQSSTVPLLLHLMSHNPRNSTFFGINSNSDSNSENSSMDKARNKKDKKDDSDGRSAGTFFSQLSHLLASDGVWLLKGMAREQHDLVYYAARQVFITSTASSVDEKENEENSDNDNDNDNDKDNDNDNDVWQAGRVMAVLSCGVTVDFNTNAEDENHQGNNSAYSANNANNTSNANNSSSEPLNIVGGVEGYVTALKSSRLSSLPSLPSLPAQGSTQGNQGNQSNQGDQVDQGVFLQTVQSLLPPTDGGRSGDGTNRHTNITNNKLNYSRSEKNRARLAVNLLLAFAIAGHSYAEIACLKRPSPYPYGAGAGDAATSSSRVLPTVGSKDLKDMDSRLRQALLLQMARTSFITYDQSSVNPIGGAGGITATGTDRKSSLSGVGISGVKDGGTTQAIGKKRPIDKAAASAPGLFINRGGNASSGPGDKTVVKVNKMGAAG